MSFLFRMHKVPGADWLEYSRGQERARKTWATFPQLYPGTFFEHLRAGDFEHLIPASSYTLEDFSHQDHLLPPGATRPRREGGIGVADHDGTHDNHNVRGGTDG